MFLSSLSALSGLQFGLDHITPFAWGILILLAILSTLSWSALLIKWHLLRRTERANRRFLSGFHDSPHPLAIYLTKEQVEFSPLFFLYNAACRELAFHLVGEEEPGRSFSARLQGAGRITPSQMGTVHNALERSVSSAALKLELRLNLVATVITLAPLLGILGTVVGLLDVFAALDLDAKAALGPGISSALLTTIAALLVVVPSVAGYNGVVNRIRGHIVRMDNFASELSGLFDRHFVDHRKLEEGLPSLGSLGVPSMPMPSSSSRSPSRP
jgi:biopolymer transport protein ExbB/TolQ